MSINKITRLACRSGALAMIDHLLRDGPAPANPYPASSQRANYWQFGANQAHSFAFPMQEPKR